MYRHSKDVLASRKRQQPLLDVVAEENGRSRSVENGYNASAEYIMDKLDELDNINYEMQFLNVAVDDWSGAKPGNSIISTPPQLRIFGDVGGPQNQC